MRFCLIIAVLLWAPAFKTVSSQTFSTISGQSQGSLPISTLPEDCPSTVDVSDIVFISAVPIAIGFGLLLLLAFLQDLRQANKSKCSCPPSPCNIRGNRARKERTYIIDVNYAGRSYWGSFLRWCALHKSSGAKKNPRLMRLQGTTGFSNWLSFDLVLGKTSEQKTLATPRSIGKLVAVETKYPSASDGFKSRLLPSSNIGACLRGIINRACDIEIKKIHAMDTKTQDRYTSGCGAGSGGISSSDQGITTIFPLLLSTTQPASRVNYIAYYFKNGSLWTSALTPWHRGNFTRSRHITCLFVCISYTMIAAQVVSRLSLDQSIEDSILMSLADFTINAAILIRAIVAGVVVFSLLGIVEIIFRGAPTIWSLHLPCISPRLRNGNRLMDGMQPAHVQSAAGDFFGGSLKSVEEGLPRLSISAPELLQQGSRPRGNTDQQNKTTTSSCFNKISRQCSTPSEAYKMMNVADNIKYDKNNACHAAFITYSQWTVINGHGIYKQKIENMSPIKTCTKPNFNTIDYSSVNNGIPARHSVSGSLNGNISTKAVSTSSCHVANTISDDIYGDNQSICPADQLECHHKLTCHKCPVCHRTTGSRYYDPEAGCSGENTSAGYKFYKHGSFIRPGYAYSSSSLDSAGSSRSSLSSNPTLADLSISSSSDSSESASISDSSVITESSSIISNQLQDESSPYHSNGAIKHKASDNDNLDNVDLTAPSAPSSKEPSHLPGSISRATSDFERLEKKHKATCKQDAGDRCEDSKHLEDKITQEDISAQEKFIKYTDALLDPEIKLAQVLRTKNYINRFSDMGKGRVVILPHRETKTWDELLLKVKFAAHQLTEDKPNLSIDESKSQPKMGAIIKTPHSPITTGSDYIISLPTEFEMPSVTIKNSSSRKPLFFNFRKWLAGLRSNPRADVGDNYKLEVTEDEAAMKTSVQNKYQHHGHDITRESSIIQIEEETKCDTKQKSFSPENANMTLPNTFNGESINEEVTNDHLKGSIFQSSSHLIEYQPEAISVVSSVSWTSMTSHSAPGQHLAPCMEVNTTPDTTNRNNNSIDTAVINMDPSSSTMPPSTSSEECLSFESNQTSSGSSSVIPKSTSSEGFSSSLGISSSSNRICTSQDTSTTEDTRGKKDISSSKETYGHKSIISSKEFASDGNTCSKTSISSNSTTASSEFTMADDEENPRWNRYNYYQTMHNVEPASTPTPPGVCCHVSQPVMFLVLHILLIASCVFALLWSVLSFHGLCWNTLWTWVTTSIIAIVIQAVILDTIKAAIMTLVRWYNNYNEAKPKPYSVIH
ncbi:uncharacterized protein LOC110979937 [Acanthaster planci]|uniref:Uncharacterized protein LOC110979937 n=1 Tax=Acanthaster planci TaxID=133434 RepID=A0A8B7YHE4_ACAPL|nr:uncharacterized protein LOC110979937 [Acanthaster planci]